MALTPEDIENRRFQAAEDGYDRIEVDRFLTEVAASYRYAMHNLLPGVAPQVADDRRAESGHTVSSPAETSSDAGATLGRLGHEVGEILRAAEQLAQKVVAEAETDAAGIRAEAERLLAEAHQGAEQDRERAKRLLVRAKEQGDTIVAEARQQAETQRRELDEEARRQTQQALQRARHQAEQIARAERDALDRLLTVRADLDLAINQLDGDGTRPLLDLTSETAVVTVTGVDDRTSPRPAAPDPVSHMVQRAVDRAIEHAESL